MKTGFQIAKLVYKAKQGKLTEDEQAVLEEWMAEGGGVLGRTVGGTPCIRRGTGLASLPPGGAGVGGAEEVGALGQRGGRDCRGGWRRAFRGGA